MKKQFLVLSLLVVAPAPALTLEVQPNNIKEQKETFFNTLSTQATKIGISLQFDPIGTQLCTQDSLGLGITSDDTLLQALVDGHVQLNITKASDMDNATWQKNIKDLLNTVYELIESLLQEINDVVNDQTVNALVGEVLKDGKVTAHITFFDANNKKIETVSVTLNS